MIVTNQSNVKYSYTIPGEPTQSGEEYSNPVDTEILSSAISKVKTSNHYRRRRNRPSDRGDYQ